jgi:CheY-like chemotaxis protein
MPHGDRLVLVVDDDDDLRASLAELLLMYGFDVLTACNGEEALQLLLVHRPSLILLDLKMPVMNGWQLLQALDADDELRALPVIVLSASLGEAPALLRATAMVDKAQLLPSALVELVAHYCTPPDE